MWLNGLFAPLNPPISEWRDQRVWLVGASSGIGAALARELARRGARIAVSARREQSLHEVLDEVGGGPNQRPVDALVLPLDVTNAGALAAARDAIVAAWGGVDVVIWLAALWVPMRADNFDLASARRTIEINQIGALNLLAAVLPVLLDQGRGQLVLTASVAGWGGMPQALAYGQTKAALNHLAETLWIDLHPRGIGVAVVNPGFVDTPATATNTFTMPALISADEAALRMLAGISAGHFNIHFPRRFTGVLKFLRLLPIRFWFAVIRRTTGL
jgi:NAD(P)-dependent dehydrogenase (short-subunit alcohol dehydrogenase family)